MGDERHGSSAATGVTGMLVDRRALVTGGGQGVGRGIALALSEAGAAVVLLGRTEQKLRSVQTEITERGGSAFVVVADVRRPEDVERGVRETIAHLGGLDVLVNNAQTPALGSVLSVDEADYIACWESGPLAAFRFMRACRPHLGQGSVVINLGSGTSVNPNPAGRGVYASAKAAIATLSRAAGVEWGPDGIRVLTVLPAATSPSAEAWAERNPAEYERSVQSIPLRRLGDPIGDIGRAVAFLCGPDAQFISATTIALDGGQAYLR
jgi:meso-butanediol dehydrogenase/(S,S)-butanediol dehydrogenase/diacetyl reductase